MNVRCWLQDCHYRQFPTGNPFRNAPLQLDIAQGESTAFQVVIANPDKENVADIRIHEQAPTSGITLRIRRVGFVPLPHFNTLVPDEERDGIGRVPGLVPDPLFDENEARIAPLETVSFWISVHSSHRVAPGRHPLVLSVEEKGKRCDRLRTVLRVYPVALKPRRHFPVVQWFYIDSLLDWYRLQPFEDKFWTLLEAYMRNLPAHGQDTIYAPVFTPPLDGVKRPSQLLHVHKNKNTYTFNWHAVKRYVDLAQKNGIRNFEWTHFFSQWGVRHALRIYEGHGEKEKLLWAPETTATSPVYRKFLSRFLPEFHSFLHREKLLDRSFFHISDEPHGEEALSNYKAAREMLLELAPWIKTMDALSEIVYGREKITDMPIPSIQVTRQFVQENIPCMTYFCCGPRGKYLNRLMDTPLIKIRMSGWLFYRFKVLGFLHWGYNYWYKSQTRSLIDPFCESSGSAWPNWAYGDTFVVYPGPQGPIDSLRWEIFGLSLQDYALLQTLAVDPDGPALRTFRDFNDFPKSVEWLLKSRSALLQDAAKTKRG